MKVSFIIDPFADNEISKLILKNKIRKYNLKKAKVHKKFFNIMKDQLNLSDEEMSDLLSFKNVIIVRPAEYGHD